MVLVGVTALWAVTSPRAAAPSSATSRRLEGRLTNTPYLPYEVPAGASQSRREDQLAATEVRARGQLEDGASVLEVVDVARLWLLGGRLDDAISALEHRVARGAATAEMTNQLAVAYLDRARQRGRPLDLLLALGAAHKAMVSDGQMPEARYNRAVALEALMLHGAALRAWREVAAREPDPKWRSDALTHLLRLNAAPERQSWRSDREQLERAAKAGDVPIVGALVKRWPEPARLFGEEELLARWAAETADGHGQRASEALAVAREIAGALSRRGGDLLLRDSVAVIDRALAADDKLRLNELVQGHASYGLGLRSYKQRRLDTAHAELSRARRSLASVGSPLVHWADLYLASCDYFRQNLDATTTALATIRSSLPDQRYPALVGRIHWILGSVEILHGRPGDSLTHFRLGSELFQAAGELDSLSGMHQHLAMALGALGDTEGAWRHLHAGLQLIPRLESPVRAMAILDEVGLSASQLGQAEAALDMREELVLMSSEFGTPEAVAVATMRRAHVLSRLRQTAAARSELASATSLAAQIPDPSLRNRDEAEIALARAELDIADDPRNAEAQATKALDFFATAGFRFYLPLAYVLRARARLAAGDEAGALEDYFASLEQIESTRRATPDRQLQIAFFDQANELFDETLAVLSRPGRPAGPAFLVAEQGRGRDLFEYPGSAGGGQAAPMLSLDAVRESLPPRTLLIRYALLPDQLLIWWLRRDGTGLTRVAVDARELEEQIDAARISLQSGTARRDIPELGWLHELLIAAVPTAMRDAKAIVIVPDKRLHLLPFGALVDSRTGRYLIEDYELSVAPTANLYVRSLARQRQLSLRPPRSAVIVGATAFDRQRFPSLRRLDGAETEARSVAALYPAAQTLTNRVATRSGLLAALASQPEVLHIAAHAVVNGNQSGFSMLLLAPDVEAGDDGVVYAHEIDDWKLEGTEVAVLAACGTAFGELSPSEGAMSLARPFLAAGVPAIVGSLWRVDDRASGQLMEEFHRRLRAGDTPQRALRIAQLAQLQRGGATAAPGLWGPFEVIVGGPPIMGGVGHGFHAERHATRPARLGTGREHRP